MTDNRWDTLRGFRRVIAGYDFGSEGWLPAFDEALASLKADYEALLNDRDEWRQGHAETLRAAGDLRAKLERIEGERDALAKAYESAAAIAEKAIKEARQALGHTTEGAKDDQPHFHAGGDMPCYGDCFTTEGAEPSG